MQANTEAGPAAVGPLVMVSVSEAARLKGVTKQTIAEKLSRLERERLIEVTRSGREKRFSLAAYDEAVGETTDPSRIVAQETSREIRGGGSPAESVGARDPSYNEALTRKVGLEGDLRQIEVDKQRGLLLEVDDVREAMTLCAETLVREIGQLSAKAEEIAAAVGQKGPSGAREVLRSIERDLRAALARSMTLLAEGGDEDEETSEAA